MNAPANAKYFTHGGIIEKIRCRIFMPVRLPYIMIIDDDQDDLDLLTTSFTNSGIETKSYHSGSQAQGYLRLIADVSPMPRLIIVDYSMPKANGQQVLTSFKNDVITQHIPVIVYSTSMSVMLKMDLLKLGAYDCFTKPCTYGELIEQASIFKKLVYSFCETKHVA
jgi:DNA-binding response OmpR family regulator